MIRFGVFELDVPNGELRKAGSVVKLQPQPFQVLALLARRAGQLVTREELQREIWGQDTFVDFERGLNICIMQVRAALGDDAESPRYIQTVPRRGYRFLGPVEAAEEARPLEKARSRPRRLPAVAAVLLALVVVAGLLLWRRPAPRAASTGGSRILLAVLPFESLGGEPEFTYGLFDETITQLGGLDPRRLGVIARTSVMQYRQARKSAAEIGRELDVEYLLEGSVRRKDNRVRLAAQLIRASDQTQVWAETYERDLSDVFAIQTALASRIAGALALELFPSPPAGRRTTQSTGAYDAYLKGRYLTQKRSLADWKKSLAYFQEAIEKDPSYAAAYSGLAEVHLRLGRSGAVAPRESFPRAKEAALQAVALQDTLVEAHCVLGNVSLWYEWNWPEAERQFRRAIELNPSYAIAHHDYAWYLIAMGRKDEALAAVRRARELDPISSRTNMDYGWLLYQAREYDEAIAQCRRALDLEPDMAEAKACLERCYAQKKGDATSRKTLPSLEKDFQARSPMMALLRSNPELDGLRGLPGFRELLRKLDLGR